MAKLKRFHSPITLVKRGPRTPDQSVNSMKAEILLALFITIDSVRRTGPDTSQTLIYPLYDE